MMRVGERPPARDDLLEQVNRAVIVLRSNRSRACATRCSGLTSMYLLVPAHEVLDSLLDADLGPVAELALGAAQIGRRQPHVARLIGMALDPHLLSPRVPDQLDHAVQPHPPPAAHVDRCGNPRPAATTPRTTSPAPLRPGRPLHR